MPMPGPDPNFVKEQQQIMRMMGLKRAKKADAVSAKKLLFIILPVLAAALAIILYTAGVFDEGRTFSWNGAIYRIPGDIGSVRSDTKPEGYRFAGYLYPAEENDSVNWHPNGEIYVKEGNERIIYLYLYPSSGYYRARKK